jgi:hypothetical protein
VADRSRVRFVQDMDGGDVRRRNTDCPIGKTEIFYPASEHTKSVQSADCDRVRCSGIPFYHIDPLRWTRTRNCNIGFGSISGREIQIGLGCTEFPERHVLCPVPCGRFCKGNKNDVSEMMIE